MPTDRYPAPEHEYCDTCDKPAVARFVTYDDERGTITHRHLCAEHEET